MTAKRKAGHSIGLCVAIGIGVSVILSLILAMITASLIMNERLSEDVIQYTSPGIILIASVAGAVIAGKSANEKVAIAAGICGVTFLLILMGTGILFFNGGFHNIWTGLVSIALGWILSCTICIRGKRRGTKRKRSYR